MKKKNLISLSVAFAFLSLSTTGLLMYFGKKMHAVEAIHVVFGLTFVCFAIFHIINNWSSIVTYAKGGAKGKIQKEFILVFVIFAIFLLGTGFDLPPFEPIKEAGKSLFGGGERKERRGRTEFDNIVVGKGQTGTGLQLIIQKNNDVLLPVIAIWVEDPSHQFVENLFVPASVATVEEGESDIREAINEGELEMKPLGPEVLPVWQSKASVKTSNFDKATPFNNFFLSTKTTATGKYFVMLEIRSGDKTELYEAAVDELQGKVFKLQSKDNEFLVRGIVELK